MSMKELDTIHVIQVRKTMQNTRQIFQIPQICRVIDLTYASQSAPLNLLYALINSLRTMDGSLDVHKTNAWPDLCPNISEIQ